jgi:hypothetical protein
MNCPDRSGIDEAVLLATERLDASDVLARSPHRAESMRVLARALGSLEDASRQLAVAHPENPLVIAESQLDSLRTFRERLERAPARDSTLTHEDLVLLQQARKLAHRVRGLLRRATISRRALLVRRLGLAATGAALLAFVWFAVTHLRDRFDVAASASYSAAFPAENAVDGHLETEWLAPEAATGWLELRFVRPISVTAVSVVNAHNGGYADRATRALDIELYQGETRVSRARFVFPKLDITPQAEKVAIAGAGVTRVRFVARSHYGKGAGLAEVEVIEAR